jgi:type VI secretion system secreted protein Hcp
LAALSGQSRTANNNIKNTTMKKYLIASAVVLLLGVTYLGAQVGLPFLKRVSAPVASAASVDYYLEIDGIDGESTSKDHPGTIEVDSWSFGASNPSTVGSGTGGGTGKVQMQDFHFTVKSSKASPQLFLATATGEHFVKATLYARKAGSNQDFLVYTLENVLVSSYNNAGGGDNQVPTDQFSLNFSKIEFTYTAQGKGGASGGSVTTGWDLAQNKKI